MSAFATLQHRVFVSLAAGLLSACASGPAPKTAPLAKTATPDWQALARQDLEATRAVIRSAHPGPLDAENPAFNDWVGRGYEEALALVPRVVTYDHMLSVVRYYATGFRDGHLVYSDDIRKDAPLVVSGWRTAMFGDKVVVSATIAEWPVPLPPVGSELLGCDGREPGAILREDVGPYVDRLEGAASDEVRAMNLWFLSLPGLELHHCQFLTPAGQTLDLEVRYRGVTWNQFFEAGRSGAHQASDRHNGFDLGDGVLWVRAAKFHLQPGTGDAAELEALLAALPTLTGYTQIVFDVRRNGGGDSSVGDRIFDAATGGLEFDQGALDALPRYYAEWRVSEVMLAAIQGRLERDTKLYGADSPGATDASRFLAEARAAKADGKTWLVQDAGRRLTRADLEARHAHLKRFDGRLVLLTDSWCVSACLDFADTVRQVPGSLHVGRTTGADASYIDMGSAALPSGNHLWIPLKVWRNRLRANNEAYVPDVTLDVDMDDDTAVRHAVLEAIAQRTPAR